MSFAYGIGGIFLGFVLDFEHSCEYPNCLAGLFLPWDAGSEETT
jgi:hypothetical protein